MTLGSGNMNLAVELPTGEGFQFLKRSVWMVSCKHYWIL